MPSGEYKAQYKETAHGNIDWNGQTCHSGYTPSGENDPCMALHYYLTDNNEKVSRYIYMYICR